MRLHIRGDSAAISSLAQCRARYRAPRGVVRRPPWCATGRRRAARARESGRGQRGSRSARPRGDFPGAAPMSTVLRLVFTFFTGTPITRGLTIAGLVLFGASILTVTYLPQTAHMLAFALVGQLALFLGSGLMPMMFGRMAQGHALQMMPFGRVKLLASALITVAIVALPAGLITPIALCRRQRREARRCVEIPGRHGFSRRHGAGDLHVGGADRGLAVPHHVVQRQPAKSRGAGEVAVHHPAGGVRPRARARGPERNDRLESHPAGRDLDGVWRRVPVVAPGQARPWRLYGPTSAAHLDTTPGARNSR